MQVKDMDGVWAMGDCAHIPNLLEDGRPYTGTARRMPSGKPKSWLGTS